MLQPQRMPARRRSPARYRASLSRRRSPARYRMNASSEQTNVGPIVVEGQPIDVTGGTRSASRYLLIIKENSCYSRPFLTRELENYSTTLHIPAVSRDERRAQSFCSNPRAYDSIELYHQRNNHDVCILRFYRHDDGPFEPLIVATNKIILYALTPTAVLA